MRWLVDGMNLIGSRPTGWWRDREGAMRELVRELDGFAEASGDDVIVVFDGRPRDISSTSVQIRFAPRRGRNAADDEIDRLVAQDRASAELTVVTSDADLSRRVRSRGARVESVTPFRRRLRTRGNQTP
jgi:predicted RNA-binding protein with PIN domain